MFYWLMCCICFLFSFWWQGKTKLLSNTSACCSADLVSFRYLDLLELLFVLSALSNWVLSFWAHVDFTTVISQLAAMVAPLRTD